MYLRVSGKGTQMSFEQAYSQYKPMMYALLRKLNIYKDQEEYIQEATIALWQATVNYNKTKGEFTLYIYMQMKYAMLQQLRNSAKKQQRECQMDQLPEQAQDVSLERMIFVEQLLQKLNQEEQFIIRAYYIDGLNHEEIGYILGKNIEAVKKKRQRAIIRLKNAVRSSGYLNMPI